MSSKTSISWCDSTWNPWRGCVKVSAGCRNCYAEKLVKRFGQDFSKPVRSKPGTFNAPLRWHKKALLCEECGAPWEGCYSASGDAVCECCGTMNNFRRRHVFLGSLMDWLDPAVSAGWLADALDIIRRCPGMDFLCLTKRPELFWARMRAVISHLRDGGDVPSDPERLLTHQFVCGWSNGMTVGMNIPKNVWIGTSVEDQQRADERIPELLRIPAKVRFLSVEPLLEPIDLKAVEFGKDTRQSALSPTYMGNPYRHDAKVDWVIVGGESGSKRRDCGVKAIVRVAEECKTAGVPCFVKQDCALGPGQQGRIPDTIWNLKEFPKSASGR